MPQITPAAQLMFGCAAIIAASGFFFRSIQPAQAYLSNNISYQQNPIWSQGGVLNGNIIAAPSGQDMIVTDLHLTLYSADIADCWFNKHLQLSTPSLGTIAEYSLHWWHNYGGGEDETGSFQASFRSGLRIPAGETLSANVTTALEDSCSTHDVRYTIAGYYAHP